jgi:hypothetical protein
MYPISQTPFVGHLNDKFFIAKRSYILESGFFLTFSAFSIQPRQHARGSHYPTGFAVDVPVQE